MATLPSAIQWIILLLGLLLSSDSTAASPISTIRHYASTKNDNDMMIDYKRVTEAFTTKLLNPRTSVMGAVEEGDTCGRHQYGVYVSRDEVDTVLRTPRQDGERYILYSFVNRNGHTK